MSILFPDSFQDTVFEKCRKDLFVQSCDVFEKFSQITGNDESKASFQIGSVSNNGTAEICQKFENSDKIFVDNDGNLIYVEENENDEKEFESIEIEFANTFKVKDIERKSNTHQITFEKMADTENRFVEVIQSKTVEDSDNYTSTVKWNVKNTDNSYNSSNISCIKNIEKVVESIQMANNENKKPKNTDSSYNSDSTSCIKNIDKVVESIHLANDEDQATKNGNNNSKILSVSATADVEKDEENAEENTDILSSVANYRDIFRALFLLLSKAHDT
jgi:hypothetical protein